MDPEDGSLRNLPQVPSSCRFGQFGTEQIQLFAQFVKDGVAVIEVAGDAIDEGAPDHDPVGHRGDGPDMFRPGNSESDNDRLAGVLADQGKPFAEVLGHLFPFPGYPFSTDIIDKSGGVPANPLNPVLRRGRGHNVDGLEPGVPAGGLPFAGFLRRQVEDQDGIDPSIAGAAGIVRKALGEDQVVVGIQDNRRLREGADFTDQMEDPSLVHAGGQGPFGGQLVGQAVSQRIRKRDAQFQDIGAAFDQRPADFPGRIKIRITGADVGDKDRPLLLAGGGESVVQSIHAPSKGGSLSRTRKQGNCFQALAPSWDRRAFRLFQAGAVPKLPIRMIVLYRILFLPGLLFVLPYYLFRMWRRGGYREGFGNRFGRMRGVPPKQAGCLRIWIQAVSVGEILALHPLLKRIRDRKDVEVILTTTTSTGFALLKQMEPGLATWCGVFPLDFLPFSRRAWQALEPDRIVLMEGELWPEHLHQARRRGVPAVLINGRLSDRSFRRYRRMGGLPRVFFSQLEAIHAGSPTDRDRFNQLGWIPPDRIFQTGNLKLDLEKDDPLGEEAYQTLLQELGFADGRDDGPDPLILLGSSTWPGEERILVEAFLALKEAFPALHLLIVPRHAERRKALQAELKSFPIRLHFRSWDRQADPGTEVAIADTTGELRRLTQLADLVFIGKSLPPNRGGQTPVEAASLGKPLLLGPEMSNFRDIARRLVRSGAARRLDSAADLLPAVRELLSDAHQRSEMGAKAAAFIESSRGATGRILEALLEPAPGAKGKRSE